MLLLIMLIIMMLRLVMINGILMRLHGLIISSGGGINALVVRVLVVGVTVIHLSTEPFNGLMPLLFHHQ